MTREPVTRTRDRWRDLARMTGVTALAAVACSSSIIAISTLGEPAFDATRDEAAEFFRGADAAWIPAAEATAALGMLVFLWFAVGLTTLLRRVEGGARVALNRGPRLGDAGHRLRAHRREWTPR